MKGQGQKGEIVTNALLDPGSDVSLCDVGLFEKFGVFGRPKEFTLTAVNGASDSQNGFEVYLVARGINLHEEITLSRIWAVDPSRLPRGCTTRSAVGVVNLMLYAPLSDGLLWDL